MDKKELAQKIIDFLGGSKNITNYWHCVTRLRFTVKDDAKADLAAIENLPGILGATVKSNQYQVVIGPAVDTIFSEIAKILDLSKNSNEVVTEKPAHQITGKVILDVISGVFQPILPALVAGGMLKGILAIVTAFSPNLEKSTTLALFNLIADVPFYFLPFLLAISSARKFKLNEYLGICMAGALLYPTFAAKITSGNSGLTLFGLNIPAFNYASSVFPVILGVGLMAIIYHFVDHLIPDVLKLVVVPAVTLIIAVPLAMWVLAPLGAYGGQYLANGIVWLFQKAGLLAGFLLGFFMPLIVLAGMHQSTSPIQIQNIATLGYDYLLPVSFVHNIAESGAAFGTSLRIKNKELRAAGFSTSFSAFIGISEPALYTVNVIHKSSMLAAMCGSGVGGMLTVLLDIKCFAFVMPGITSLPVYVKAGQGFANVLLMGVCLITAFSVSALCALILGNKVNDENLAQTALKSDIVITAPASGTVVPLEEVADPVFSEKMMGAGFAVKPVSDEIYAPVSGKVTMLAKTKHGIGITTSEGVEILLHLGIDTVELKGDPFQLLVHEGDQVTAGQKIALMNIKQITKSGKDPTVIFVITNSADKVGKIAFAQDKGAIDFGGIVMSAELI